MSTVDPIFTSGAVLGKQAALLHFESDVSDCINVDRSHFFRCKKELRVMPAPMES